MEESFQLRGLKLIRENVPLSPHEFSVLQYLITAAENKEYWDRLYRLDENCRIIVRNIAARARMAGVQPLLEGLKEEMDAEAAYV